jgi:hypothetical protein
MLVAETYVGTDNKTDLCFWVRRAIQLDPLGPGYAALAAREECQ